MAPTRAPGRRGEFRDIPDTRQGRGAPHHAGMEPNTDPPALDPPTVADRPITSDQPPTPDEPPTSEQPPTSDQAPTSDEPPSDEQSTSTASGTRRLRHDTGDRVLGGVASGVAHYLGIDPVAVRVGFVVLAALGGSGVLLYFAGWLLIPADTGRAVAHDWIERGPGAAVPSRSPSASSSHWWRCRTCSRAGRGGPIGTMGSASSSASSRSCSRWC